MEEGQCQRARVNVKHRGELMDVAIDMCVCVCVFRFTTPNPDPAANPTYMDHAASPAVSHPQNYAIYQPM